MNNAGTLASRVKIKKEKMDALKLNKKKLKKKKKLSIILFIYLL
jgi:hypothetical protein